MKSINDIRKGAGRIRTRAGSLLAYTLFTAIATGMASEARAQTFAEWFKQKSTQKKYLLQQIAALEAYGDALKKGYQIAGQGVGSISAYLLTENSLHQEYYQKLRTVSPLARQSPQVSEIVSWRNDIFHNLSCVEAVMGLSQNERNYLLQVRRAVLEDCEEQISRLEDVLTNSKLEMSDAERLGQIAAIHSAMQQNFHFTSGFTRQVTIYSLQRRQEKSNATASKQLYAIH